MCDFGHCYDLLCGGRALQALQDGADVDVRDAGGLTALGVAVVQAKHEIVELLISQGADVNATQNLAPQVLPNAANSF